MTVTPKMIRDKIFSVANWVDPEKTADRIEHGDANRPIRKIGVSWMACHQNLEAAVRDGCDLFISHEPCCFDYWRKELSDYRLTPWGEKRLDILNTGKMSCMAFHDTWDNFPEYGIRDSWRSFLGVGEMLKECCYSYPDSDRHTVRPSLTLNSVDPTTLGKYARYVAGKIKVFNSNGVIVMGKEDAPVKSVALGVGCHIPFVEMLNLGADVLIQVLDRAQQTVVRVPACEIGANIIVVEHGIPEMPGMQNMVRYLKSNWPELEATFYCHEPYSKFIAP